MTLLELLERRSHTFHLCVSLSAVVLLAALKFYAGPGYTFLLFYLVPVFLAAWYVGRRAGFAVSAASAVAYYLAEELGRGFEARPFVPAFNLGARLCAFLFVTYSVSALRRSLDQARAMARTDSLTGVFNRRWFFEAADQEIRRARRHRHPFTVAYIDIDDFKEVNDRFGHSTGDAVLRALVQTIQRDIREVDMLARLGGDEFIILLPETDAEAAQSVVTRVRRRMLEAAAREGWPVGFSIGVVTWTSAPRTVDMMVKQADDMMYEVKNTGKNRIAHLRISGEPGPDPALSRSRDNEPAPPAEQKRDAAPGTDDAEREGDTEQQRDAARTHDAPRDDADGLTRDAEQTGDPEPAHAA
jgi:diguanylate cyclase (GGDEF)-like protein